MEHPIVLALQTLDDDDDDDDDYNPEIFLPIKIILNHKVQT
jgi:hypothetical protein